MDQIVAIINNMVEALPALAAIVGGFALLATLTPNKSDDKIVQTILDVVNFLGANLGKAKNSGE